MPDNHFKSLPWTKLRRGVPCYLPKAAVGARVKELCARFPVYGT